MSAPREPRLGVLQMVDTLAPGGAERVAVNLANSLPRNRVRSHLCTTRRPGALAADLADDVGQLHLGRRRRFDPAALGRLRRYLRRERIDVIHAHGPSLLTAVLATGLQHRTRVLWHLHAGRYALEDRPPGAYRWLAPRAGHVVAVSEALVDWATRRLSRPPGTVTYLPNFLPPAAPVPGPPPALPGDPSARIVCVANLRPEKDQPTLIAAMARVHDRVPAAHLLLVGAPQDAPFTDALRAQIADRGLGSSISLLGVRDDVPALLEACSIGVLSSRFEGFPMVLLEYGRARLPVVATNVGQCTAVLDHGRAGVLVPPEDPRALAQALVALLQSATERADLGAHFHDRVRMEYSAEVVLTRLVARYTALAPNTALAPSPS